MSNETQQYIVGIDLGTTNSVVAYTRISDRLDEPINIFKIPQIVDVSSINENETLPSFILIPGSKDVPQNSLELPWDKNNNIAIGEYARKRGAEIPQRMIASSKSWLCHKGVDRMQPILPWEGPQDMTKMSPVQASASILKHIRQAWNFQIAKDEDKFKLENQDVYLTVPASFDAVAKDLTVKAAEIAGLTNITLIEEPQAAFYSWIENSKDKWRELIKVKDMILVCDIGGGTSDFTLIRVSDQNGELSLERIAVGDHLLVGGDNMDITLAHAVSKTLSEKNTKLDPWQMRGLWLNCRDAKEYLYANDTVKSHPITILGRGSSVIGSTIKTKLARKDLDDILDQGFFPICDKDAKPNRERKTGIREMGLQYESDPAITKHLAYFLDRHLGNESNDVYPTVVLFNGGVMKASSLRNRILDALNKWADNKHSVRELANEDLELAVARGAAYYGQARRGKGIRIRAGLSKTYYIGIQSSLPAVPGMPAPMKALCVAPFGLEEGSQVDLSGQEFGLIVGEPVQFDFLGSTVRQKDAIGSMNDTDELSILPVTQLQTTLEGESGSIMPVTIRAKATEIGTLELWCVSKDNQKWKLEFSVRAN